MNGGPRDSGSGDEDLRALLRATDPAAGLEPVDPGWTSWKARQVVAEAAAPVRGRPTRRRTRTRRAGVLAGAGFGTAAAAVVAALTVGTSGAAVTALSLPPASAGGPASSCAEITPDALAQRSSALEGRVTGVEDGRAVLEVTHRYRGDVEDEVTVPQPAPDLGPEFSPGRFTVGSDYLIATLEGGQVAVCGQSGPATPELRALYREAFGG